MSFEFKLTKKDGMYDFNGKPVVIEDMINAYLEGGGKVERTTEDTTIYTMNNGEVATIVKKCEVIKFRS